MPHTVTQDDATRSSCFGEAFHVQLENAGPLELVDGAPKMRIALS